MNNIYLVGMMGSGKTTIATALGARLQRPVQEMDALIVAREGMSINDIFAQKKEPYFRAVETEVLRDVSVEKEHVISTGGGVVLSEENMQRMKASGVVVYLQASVDTLYHRLLDKTDRPLLQGDALREKLETLCAQRAEQYARADVTVHTDNKLPDTIVDDIIAMLKEAL